MDNFRAFPHSRSVIGGDLQGFKSEAQELFQSLCHCEPPFAALGC
jgi:hypothetical protein